MKRYKGLRADLPRGGGSYVEEHGEGGEVYNFKNEKGRAYGYTETWTIDLTRLGAKRHDEYLDNVTVVWFARNPQYGGQYIVGWFSKARVFREKQEKNFGVERRSRYNVETKFPNTVLIPESERNFELRNPPPGQSFVWFGHEHMSNRMLNQVWDYIRYRKIPAVNTRRTRGIPYQPDIEKRLRVERKAVRFAFQYFKNKRFKVVDVQKENKGWDLEAIKNAIKLDVEVKGFSSDYFTVELTPNEYKHFRKKRKNYVLFIVTNALKKNPQVYYFRIVKNRWRDYNEHELVVLPLPGARITLKD